MNKIMLRLLNVSLLLMLGTTVTVFSQNYQVSIGEKIRVRLEDKLTSKSSQPGDRFTTKVTEPVYSSNGVVVIPNGSKVFGRVDSVKKAEKGGKPGELSVSFNRLQLPNGRTRNIVGTLTSLDTKSAKSDNEGSARAGKMKNRKVIFIGGGGAGGAIIGAAIGGGKGALIGGIIGAAGGVLGERLTKGKEAEVKSGTEFGVFIEKAFYLPKYSSIEIRKANDGEPSEKRREKEKKYAGGIKYIVRRGDTLGRISFRFYGTTSRYLEIYDANRDRLRSPSSIEVGQELIIP